MIAHQASLIGVKNFVSLYSAYVKMVAAINKTSGDNVTEFEGQPLELYTGDYSCDEYGVFTHDKYGFDIKVCNHPIMPVRRLVNVDTGQVLEDAYSQQDDPFQQQGDHGALRVRRIG
jgi:hypothetical protein